MPRMYLLCWRSVTYNRTGKCLFSWGGATVAETVNNWYQIILKLPAIYIGRPTKMSLFFFGNNFYKKKETFKIFSPQLLEVYRILLVETTLESKMFPYTALLYDSRAATRTLKLSSISRAIHPISLLMMASLVRGLFSQTLSFRYTLRKQSDGLISREQQARGYRFDAK